MGKKRNNGVIEEMIEYLNNRYYERMNLKMLAERYHMNKKYLGRLFKKECGKSFSEYLNDIRLKHAEMLLLSEKQLIIDISLDCGFENVTYFNGLFKKKYGTSPLKYRTKKP